MSKILVVSHDPRTIPSEALWWRKRLYPCREYPNYYYVMRADVPGWAYSVEYFDGRNDWTFPYKVKVSENLNIDRFRNPEAPRIRDYKIDILDVVPPLSDPLGYWEPITQPGDFQHPEDTLVWLQS
ncbi:hypothetical protein J4U01_gp106 [Mycobacterium phage Kumao]|uniref:Uncharacterized protein n=1 Tax=Mycobacterium phage Kumao TaxID=2041344 RepID=A0A2D1GPT5_9CAUD|nr:hypothetical protein J4U01_gp106 [Mycobacterium phage Kumao]ATN94052.1 hypothetical protein SEA_KUMAO_90 [Mycobacterium phage Kumao]